MAFALRLIVLLGLSSGLWMGANGKQRGYVYANGHYANNASFTELQVKDDKSKFVVEQICGLTETARTRYFSLFGYHDCCMACPEGWAEKNGRCYLFFFDEKDWCDAESHCISKGGNLASFHNATDVGVIRDYVFDVAGKATFSVRTRGVWFGGTDAVKAKHWKWSDGSAFSFTGWAPGEPNNYRGREHCMAMSGTWLKNVNDLSCDRKFSYICARDLEARV